MKTLLSLKADYKTATGQDWKPGAAPPAPAPAAAPVKSEKDADQLNQLIADQGNKVRDLKAKKAPKVRFFFVTWVKTTSTSSSYVYVSLCFFGS